MVWCKETCFFLSSSTMPRKQEQGLGCRWREGCGGEERHMFLWQSWVGEKFSGLGSLCQGQGWEEERKSLALGTASLVPSCRVFSIWDTFVLSFAGTSGNDFHLEAWVSPRNCSSLPLVWTVKSTFWCLWNTVAQEHSDGCNVSKSKATMPIPSQCTQFDRGRSHSWRQMTVWLWEDGPPWCPKHLVSTVAKCKGQGR